MAKKKQSSTTDAIAIIDRRIFRNRPDLKSKLAEIEAADDVAREIYRLRVEAGLTQRQLAKLVRTTASVICRLEDADYEGHSLTMLRRVAAALDKRLEIRFVPLGGKPGRT